MNMHSSLVVDAYSKKGMHQTFLREDELSVKLFTLLTKMQSPLAKDFFAERQQSEAMFDAAVKTINWKTGTRFDK